MQQNPDLTMGDKRPRWNRSDAERSKRWLLENVEMVDALTRAVTIRMSDIDRDTFASSLSTLDVQQLRYLCGKLDEIMARLQVWHDQIRDALDRRGPCYEEEIARKARHSQAEGPSQMDIEWLDPWYPVEDAERENLEGELRREIAPGHTLFGIPVVAIGRRKDQDDVLFRLRDGTDRLAVVHLAWPTASAEVPPCPSAKFYEDLAAWMQSGLLPDHEKWWSELSFEELDD
jgi:hypothetical protein